MKIKLDMGDQLEVIISDNSMFQRVTLKRVRGVLCMYPRHRELDILRGDDDPEVVESRIELHPNGNLCFHAEASWEAV